MPKEAITTEVNFDGLVGPSHNYAGLAHGNLASALHGNQISNPRAAALQGIEKMRFLRSLGLTQGILPPQERPHVELLRQLGFCGSDHAIVERAYKDAPLVLAASYSSSAMWAANAATVSPSADTRDSKVHFTPANMVSSLHRSIEADATFDALSAIFFDKDRYSVHRPLPATSSFADEGAANHTRLCTREGTAHLFVHGRVGLEGKGVRPTRFPARQTLEASRAISRRHMLQATSVYAQQSPQAIDAGVFHNDVISVGHHNVLLYHERAFLHEDETIQRLRAVLGPSFCEIRIREQELSLEDAVKSYLFNSQLVSPRSDGMLELIAPAEAEGNPNAFRALRRIQDTEHLPIAAVHFIDVRQSMNNGGGPACLRLRVELSPDELKCVNPNFIADDALLDALVTWVERHYRDRLHPSELRDPKLLQESRTALDALTKILHLGSSFYPFQRSGPAARASDSGRRG
ncbi:MAG: N-succinylarginine dihydrolase [Myxococcota bacterium]